MKNEDRTKGEKNLSNKIKRISTAGSIFILLVNYVLILIYQLMNRYTTVSE